MDLLQEPELRCQTPAGQTERSFNATLKVISYLMCHQLQKIKCFYYMTVMFRTYNQRWFGGQEFIRLTSP